MSLPSAPAVINAATDAADPPELPPGEREVSSGFFVAPKYCFSLQKMAKTALFSRFQA